MYIGIHCFYNTMYKLHQVQFNIITHTIVARNPLVSNGEGAFSDHYSTAYHWLQMVRTDFVPKVLDNPYGFARICTALFP